METTLPTFATAIYAAKSSSNAARICFPETGGTKNRGRAQSGICNWRRENSFVLMKAREGGKSTVCTTSHFRSAKRRFNDRHVLRRTPYIQRIQLFARRFFS